MIWGALKSSEEWAPGGFNNGHRCRIVLRRTVSSYRRAEAIGVITRRLQHGTVRCGIAVFSGRLETHVIPMGDTIIDR